MYTKLFQKNYDLLRWLYPAVNHMPKSQRFVLGNRMETLGLGILEATIGLTERDSRIVRHRILVRIQQLQTLVRLSKDLSFLSFKQYEHASSILEEMRHLLQTGGGAWIKPLNRSAPSEIWNQRTGRQEKENALIQKLPPLNSTLS